MLDTIPMASRQVSRLRQEMDNLFERFFRLTFGPCSILDEAQEAKLNLVCRKLDLQPGMRVLDIG